MSAVPSIPNYYNRRVELRRRASAALEQRLVDAGIPPQGGGREVEDVLVAGVSPEAEARALEDLVAGDGALLRPTKDGTIPFCSAASAAAIAINSFAVFADRPYADPALGLTLQAPRFEQRYRVARVKSYDVPRLDVVVGDDEQALLVDSQVMEPWHQPAEFVLDAQYDAPAAAASPGLAATVSELRSGALAYVAVDAARLVRQLLGVLSARAAGKLPERCALVALHWAPADADRYADLYALLTTELADLAERLGDQPVAVRALSYADLWAGWAADDAPDWLRAHAQRLRDQYAISLRM